MKNAYFCAYSNLPTVKAEAGKSNLRFTYKTYH